MTDNPHSLEHLVDLHGPDFGAWPDLELAQQARTEALRDPVFRQKLDAAKRAGSALRELSSALDTHDKVNDRISAVEAAVLARLEPRQHVQPISATTLLSRLAASILIAGAVGVGAQEWIPLQFDTPAEAYDQLLLGSSIDGAEGNTAGGKN